MIKAAIFDVDGTVLDSMWVWRKADEEYLKKLGIEFDEAVYNKMHTMTFETSVVYFCRAFHLDISPEQLRAEITEEVSKYYKNVIGPVKGVPELIKDLYGRGVKLAVATSNRRDFAKAAFCRLGLYEYFAQFLTCDELGTGKNEPLIFKLAANLLGAKPEETVVFEDSLHAIETAKKAGFKTVNITEYDVSDEAVRGKIINGL